MAGDGGGWSEKDEAMKFVSKRKEPTRDWAEFDLDLYFV